MPLGRDYDWSGAMGDMKEYYRNMYPRVPGFLDMLLQMAPLAIQFIPGIGMPAKFALSSLMEGMSAQRSGQPYSPDWQTLMQLTQPEDPLQQWLKKQMGTTMGIATGQGSGTGMGALNPFGQALFDRGTGLDVDWKGFQKPESKEGSVLEEMRRMYTKQGPQAMRKLYEKGELSESALEFLSKSGYAKMFPGVLPTTATEGVGPKFEQVWHWLGKPAKQTPSGIATEFKKQGYSVNPETDTWESPKKPKIPTEWLKAPEKQRATIQKWVADWKKYIFTPWDKRGEKGNFEELGYIEKRAHFSDWARRIPVTLRAEVAKRVGLATPLGKLPKPSPPGKKPEYTQEQMDSYNACRDRGGTEEACKVEAGL